MGWTDRDYNQSKYGGPGGQLLNVLNGSVKIFRLSGIDVRIHASLIITVILVLVFGLGQGFTWQDRLQSMSLLFTIVLLHEFGHCYASRWVGGEPDEIMMTPIGGLASAKAPHRPLATFLTIAGGPAVNVILCIIAGSIITSIAHRWPWNPFDVSLFFEKGMRGSLPHYSLWVYQISYILLLFNMLPIFPLDGGQMLQSILWPKFGYAKSMNFACVTGMIGAVVVAIVGIGSGKPILVFLGVSGFITCRNMRTQLKALGADLELRVSHARWISARASSLIPLVAG